LVLSRQPCITPGAGHSFRGGLAGSGGGGVVVVGLGCSSASVVNGCDCALSKRAHPEATSSAVHNSASMLRTGRPGFMQARLRSARRAPPLLADQVPPLLADQVPPLLADQVPPLLADQAPHSSFANTREMRRANPRSAGELHLPWQL